MKPPPAWFPFNRDAPRWLLLLIAVLIGLGVGGVGVLAWELTLGEGLGWPGIGDGAWALLGVVVATVLNNVYQERRSFEDRKERRADEALAHRRLRAAEELAAQKRLLLEAQATMDQLLQITLVDLDFVKSFERVMPLSVRLRSNAHLLADQTVSAHLNLVNSAALAAVKSSADDRVEAWGEVMGVIEQANRAIGVAFRTTSDAVTTGAGVPGNGLG